MFRYLIRVLDHILNANLLVKSHRKVNFELFIATLEKLCPIVFALDHVHYSRWLPVFVHELKLKVADPDMFEKFHNAVKKSHTKFSAMSCDQTHEQTNKLIKSKSGLAYALNNEDTRFLIIPEIHCYLEQVEDKKQFLNNFILFNLQHTRTLSSNSSY